MLAYTPVQRSCQWPRQLLDRVPALAHDYSMTTSHTNCTHPATKADRAACRRRGFAPAPATTPQVRCHDCGAMHEATFSHISDHGQGDIYAVICTDRAINPDFLTDYYTTEVVIMP
jgi:hypothetical protein